MHNNRFHFFVLFLFLFLFFISLPFAVKRWMQLCVNCMFLNSPCAWISKNLLKWALFLIMVKILFWKCIFSHVIVCFIFFLFHFSWRRISVCHCVCLFEMLQTTKATVEIKELEVDISKDSGSKPNLFVKLHILPIVVHMGEPRFCSDQSSNLGYEGQSSCAIMERSSASFICEEFSLSCEFGHDRYCLSIFPYFKFLYRCKSLFTEKVIFI